MTSDLASAIVTVAGGGLLLAKNCAIILLRNALKPTRPPTSTASSSPTMMNQRTIRTGRARGFPVTGWPEILDSVTMFMSCTFCSYRLPRIRRHLAIQMGGNRGFVKSNSAENEFAKLPFKIDGIAVRQAGDGRKSRQRRHQDGVMREPEQIERRATDMRCVARHHGAVERSGKNRPDQIADLGIEQPGEFAVVEMARGHQPKPL